MKKMLFFIFSCIIFIFMSACVNNKEIKKETSQKVELKEVKTAKDLNRLLSYNKLDDLKEGIWHVEEWKKAAQRLCEESKGKDCSVLAEVYHDYFYGYGSKADRAKSQQILRKSCDLGDAKSCLRLGRYNAEKEDRAEGDKTRSNADFKRAYSLAKMGCENDYAMDCHVLSLMYFEGYSPLERDRARAKAFRARRSRSSKSGPSGTSSPI